MSHCPYIIPMDDSFDLCGRDLQTIFSKQVECGFETCGIDNSGYRPQPCSIMFTQLLQVTPNHKQIFLEMCSLRYQISSFQTLFELIWINFEQHPWFSLI